MGGGERATVANPVIARSAGDEAIHAFFAARWIASLPLAMTGVGRYSPLPIQRRRNAAHPRAARAIRHATFAALLGACRRRWYRRARPRNSRAPTTSSRHLQPPAASPRRQRDNRARRKHSRAP